ncbi:hypothetical protein [Melghirimyces algeriensis]|nr:hypothetical protein [Melghirimyces algeriensis]
MIQWMQTLLLFSGILLTPLHALSLYIDSENPCPGDQRCWEFAANIWHMEGKSEALRSGKAFYFDGDRDNRLELLIDPDDDLGKLMVEVFDPQYHPVKRRQIQVEKRRKASIPLSQLGTGKYHVMIYFLKGGKKAKVTGKLYY